MKKNKKIILSLAVCAAVFGISFGAAYAFLISGDKAVNTFTVGETAIEIVEEGYTPPDVLEPGVSFAKDPKIKNTGNLPCYIRARIVFSSSAAESFCELDIDTENWFYNPEDGYYYYIHSVQPEESTSCLFTEVQILDDADPNDIIDFDIMVYAEAVQSTDSDAGEQPYLTAFQNY